MSRFLFVTWNGGGNLSPALGIARELLRREHAVRFLGAESQRARILAAGCSFTPFVHRVETDASADTPPAERFTRLLASVWLNLDLADETTPSTRCSTCSPEAPCTSVCASAANVWQASCW